MIRLVTASVFVVLTLSLLSAQAAPPDPVAADPARYAVLYENDVALMIRAKFPAQSQGCTVTLPVA